MQVMLMSPELPLKRLDQSLGVTYARKLYVIVNNRLTKPYSPVQPRLGSIAAAAVSSLIGGSGGGDLYRIFAIAQRDDVALQILGIPRDFGVESKELFDPAYMKALYEVGYEYGTAGDRWEKRPPDFAPWP